MLYNNPVGYPVDVTPSMFVELADVPNLVAIKESSANTRRITELRIAVGDRYALFVGVDDLILESSILGIDGWVAGSGIAVPKENQYFWELTRRGRWEEARAMYRWFYPLLKLDSHVKFVQYIKLAVQEAGLGREWVRESAAAACRSGARKCALRSSVLHRKTVPTCRRPDDAADPGHRLAHRRRADSGDRRGRPGFGRRVGDRAAGTIPDAP